MAKNDDAPAPSAPDPWEVLNRVATALERLQAAPVTPQSEAQTSTLMAALARLAEVNIEGNKQVALEMRRAARPSNEVVPGISVFNRRGTNLPAGSTGPIKAQLKCLMMVPFLVEWESATREEVDLLNLLQPGEYNLTLSDKSKVRFGVKMTYKLDGVTPSRLIMHDIDQDGKQGSLFTDKSTKNLVPALSDWCRQLLRQHKDELVRKQAAAVMTDEEEEALIEAGQLTVSA